MFSQYSPTVDHCMLENAYTLQRTESTYLKPCAAGSLQTVEERRLQQQSWRGAETGEFNRAERDTSMKMQPNDNQH